ncbi:MAG TPA: HAD family phosphatase [Pirellulales bacterium]
MPPAFIYFDVGNVLCFFSREQQIRQCAEVAGVAEAKIKDLLIGSQGLHWRYETGEVNDEQFYDEFCRTTGSRPDPLALRRANSEIFTFNATLLPLVGHLEDAQIPLGILSNTSPSHWQVLTDGRYGILPGAFEKLVLSYEVGALKPEEKIYRRAIELAGVPPEQIFFADDMIGHIEAARKLGIDAVQYTTTEALWDEFRKRGVRCNF